MMRPTFQEFRAMIARTITLEYATVGEVLEFVNRVREAGGAETIDRLPNAVPRDPERCLLARALNFDCEVRGYGRWPSGATIWHMVLPSKSAAEVAALAEALGLEHDSAPSRRGLDATIVLPEEIGNVARAFDLNEGWTRDYGDYLA
jgi:hypothetical protein